MSGLYLNPYRGYEGKPGNIGGLSIPHRSKYNCSSNLRTENPALHHDFVKRAC